MCTIYCNVYRNTAQVQTAAVSLRGCIACPVLWTAECPVLYTVVVRIVKKVKSKGAGGGVGVCVGEEEEGDVEACRVGFKEVRIGGPHNQLMVNRRPITVAGVYICVCMYVCVYVCMYLCMYVCMYVHMYVGIKPSVVPF
jgi:hypothetical protein